MFPAEFSYERAESVEHALAVLAAAQRDGTDVKVLAGGQSLLPMMKLRLAVPEGVLDIAPLRAHDGPLSLGAAAATLPALTTYRELQHAVAASRTLPALGDALAVLADPQVRARGTIGGALAHADPAADLPAVLLALDATVTIARQGGTRTVPLDDFLKSPYETDLAEDELITGIAFGPAEPAQAYEKFEQPASHLPLAGVCVALILDHRNTITSARIAVTGVSGRPFRARSAEQALAGCTPGDKAFTAAAARIACDAGRPLEDLHASGGFRLHLAEVMASRALERAAARGSR
jgi:aerobic carbon-monoxide dehydrogenase medium subunit